MCRRVEFTDVEIFKFRVFRIRGVPGFRGLLYHPDRTRIRARVSRERKKERRENF